jgi:hypothetical protein
VPASALASRKTYKTNQTRGTEAKGPSSTTIFAAVASRKREREREMEREREREREREMGREVEMEEQGGEARQPTAQTVLAGREASHAGADANESTTHGGKGKNGGVVYQENSGAFSSGRDESDGCIEKPEGSCSDAGINSGRSRTTMWDSFRASLCVRNEGSSPVARAQTKDHCEISPAVCPGPAVSGSSTQVGSVRCLSSLKSGTETSVDNKEATATPWGAKDGSGGEANTKALGEIDIDKEGGEGSGERGLEGVFLRGADDCSNVDNGGAGAFKELMNLQAILEAWDNPVLGAYGGGSSHRILRCLVICA